jgi:thiamine pyrophosphate-dependent acetolactate synthase large subunit-like protein
LGLRGNRIDVAKSYNGTNKMVASVNFMIASQVHEDGFTYLRTGRPSPVVLELPGDVAAGELEDSQFSYKPVRGWKPSGDPRDIELAARAIMEAQNPIRYVGQGVFWADACEELRKFAELVQAPVVTTLVAKSAFPENHPLSMGFVRGDPVVHFLEKADLIFSIGSTSIKHNHGAAYPQRKRSVIDERTSTGTPTIRQPGDASSSEPTHHRDRETNVR